jgi:hypothetical protein
MTARIVAAGVLAGCYPKSHKWSEDRCLVHAVEVDAEGDLVRVLCGGVKLSSISDDSTQFDVAPVSCPKCLKKRSKK